MELQEALLARRSIRRFTEEPVSQEAIDALLHAAMSGPSACNRRPWAFYVVTREETLAQLRGASRFSKIIAPLAIVVCGDLSRALPGHMAPYWIQDCSAAAQNILLCAVDLGLGAVWCGVHPQAMAEERVRAALSLEESKVPLGILLIGHADETQAARDQYEAACVHEIR